MLGKKSLVEQDMPAALTLLEDISRTSKECLGHLQVLQSRVTDSAVTDAKGMSFLSVKNAVMLQYCADLALTCDLKAQGRSVEVTGGTTLGRLVEGRTVLEKMRPIESKLRYQINKVVRMYKEGKVDPSDPRKFKANFGSFSNMDGGEESEEEEDGQNRAGDKKTKLYVAPKVAPVHYAEEETKEEMLEKHAAKVTRKKLSKDMMQEMREMYTDAPAEIFESDVHRHKKDRSWDKKTRYEEENFTRLPITKKEKMAQRKISTMSSLGVMANFHNDFDDDLDGPDGPPNKKKKMGGKKGGKKKGKKGYKVFYK